MPELPEVETVANAVHARIHGQTVVGVQTSNKPQTFKSPPDEIIEALTATSTARVHRLDKPIVIALTRKKNPTQPPAPLGMPPPLLLPPPDTPTPPPPHATLPRRSGKELRFVDPRR